MHVVECPHCHRKFKVPRAVSAARMKCSACGASFVGSSEQLPDPVQAPREAPAAPPAVPRPMPRRPGPIPLVVCIVGLVGIVVLVVAFVWVRTHPTVVTAKLDRKTGIVIEQGRERLTEKEAQRRIRQSAALARQKRMVQKGQLRPQAAGPGVGAPGDPAGMLERMSRPAGPANSPASPRTPSTAGKGDPMLQVGIPALVSAGAVGDDYRIACGSVLSLYDEPLARVTVAAYVDGERVQARDYPYVPPRGTVRYSLPLPAGVDSSRLKLLATCVRAGPGTVIWEVPQAEVSRKPELDGSTTWSGRARNRADVPLKDVVIYIDFYDRDGVWGGAAQGRLEGAEVLGVGKSGFFRVKTTDLKAATAEIWSVRVVGVKY